MSWGSNRVATLFRAGAVASLLVVAASAARAQADAGATRRALLVGVESYPKQSGWPALSGPLADVAALRQALIERCSFPPDHVRVLPENEATHDGILAAFEQLVHDAGPQDLVFFYFAGHGSQLPDDDGDETDGLDETLVPIQPADSDGRPLDLRDDDLRRLIERANERTPQVVLMFDCCSSGTNVRGRDDAEGGKAGARRFVPPSARGLTGVRPGGKAPDAGKSPDGAPREAGSGYFSNNLSYVALSACRSSESAYEHVVDAGDGEGRPRRVNGLFTWALLQELNTGGAGGPPANYADLMERVRQRVHSVQPRQTPVLEGKLDDLAPFAGGVARAAATLRVHEEVRDDSHALVVDGGLVHGLRTGDVLAVGGADILEHLAAPDTARLRLLDVAVASSRAEWLAPHGGASPSAPPPGGWRGVVIEHGGVDGRVGVAIEADDAPAAELAALRDALGRAGNLRLQPGDGAALTLHGAREDGATLWSVRTATGAALPLKLPKAAAAAAAAVTATADPAAESPAAVTTAALVRLVDEWAATQRLRESICNETSPVLSAETDFERLDAQGKPLGPLLRDADGMPYVHPGDWIGARLVNTSSVPIFVSLLVISPDGGVSVAVRPQNEDDALPPGATFRSPRLNEQVPKGAEGFYAAAPECYRWVVTTTLHDLRPLQCPPATERPATRGAPVKPKDPLAGRRNLDAWLTHTTEIRVVVGP